MQPAPESLLEVENLTVRFPARRNLLGQTTEWVEAVSDVSFRLPRGRTLGIVGESGSGKTTLARAILRLIPASGGAVRFEGRDVLNASAATIRAMRRRMQIIFQDPYGSLNPRMTVGRALAEPMRYHGVVDATSCEQRVASLLQQVGLRPEHAARYPHEFSGGQRQRIGIARALAVEPALIVCDEPVSALDVSVQAQVLNLLRDLQERLGLTYLFIAHNLAVVEHFCDDVAVMYRGRIVESSSVEALFSRPSHPYTRELLAAVPDPDPDRRRPSMGPVR